MFYSYPLVVYSFPFVFKGQFAGSLGHENVIDISEFCSKIFKIIEIMNRKQTKPRP